MTLSQKLAALRPRVEKPKQTLRLAARAVRLNARYAMRWRGQKPRVYLHHLVHNPIWSTYRSHPPLRYAPYPGAELCHWVSRIGLPIPLPSWRRKGHIYEIEHMLILAEQANPRGDGRVMQDWTRVFEEADTINGMVENPDCRAILTFSRGLVENFKTHVRPDLWHKLKFAHPAYPTQRESGELAGTLRERERKPFTILIIASRWSDKGLPEALRALGILRARHGDGVKMTLVSQAVPAGAVLPEGVEHFDVPLMTEEFKARVYRGADVLLLPNYGETVACFPEAYAFGVPVVTTRIHHGDEFVREGETGWLIETPIWAFSQEFGRGWKTSEEFLADLEERRARGELEGIVEQITDRLETMIQGKRDAMRQASLRFHAECFSPQARNRQLRRIYADAQMR